MRTLSTLFALSLLTAASALAQDPVEVDPDHYKVELENEHVRVLRITYGPNEKSVMHYHPAHVAVLLNEQKGQFTLPNGEVIEFAGKAGDVLWVEGGQHLPQNTMDQPLKVIVIEMKDGSMPEGDN